MIDPTEAERKEMIVDANTQPAERGYLEERYGKDNVWTTQELQEAFEVLWFLAPLCGVIRKSDNVMGNVEFMHDPRFYYNFTPSIK